MTPSRWLTVLTLSGVAIVVGLSYLSDQQSKNPAVAKIDATGDSLDRTGDTLKASLAESEQQRHVSEVAQAASLKRELTSRATSAALQRRADSLARLAATTDSSAKASAVMWRLAYQARDSEARELKTQVAEAHQQRDSAYADNARLERDLGDVKARMEALDRFNAEIRIALHHATECRIVGPIRCPSRVQTAVGLLVVMAASNQMSRLRGPR